MFLFGKCLRIVATRKWHHDITLFSHCPFSGYLFHGVSIHPARCLVIKSTWFDPGKVGTACSFMPRISEVSVNFWTNRWGESSMILHIPDGRYLVFVASPVGSYIVLKTTGLSTGWGMWLSLFHLFIGLKSMNRVKNPLHVIPASQIYPRRVNDDDLLVWQLRTRQEGGFVSITELEGIEIVQYAMAHGR